MWNCSPVRGSRYRCPLDQNDIGSLHETAPLTFGRRAEEAQQRIQLLCGNGSA